MLSQIGTFLGIPTLLRDEVQQPIRHNLDVDLSAFLLEKALQSVVALPLRRHRPELADDGHFWLDPSAIYHNTRQDSATAIGGPEE